MRATLRGMREPRRRENPRQTQSGRRSAGWQHICLRAGRNKTQAIAKRVLAAGHGLKLTFAQIIVLRIAAIELASEREPAVEIVQQRKAAGINLAAGVLDSKHAGTGVAGEQDAQVSGDSGLFRNGLLPDEVEPIVSQSRSELLAWRRRSGIPYRNWRQEPGAASPWTPYERST